MKTVTSIMAMQRLASRWRRQGARVGLVPTMGYLHEGHLALIRRARRWVGRRGRVVVSVYVNPTQFGPKEDLALYPRDLRRDLKLCRAEGVDVVFAPTDAEMYPGWVGGRRCESATGPRFNGLRYSTYVVEEQLSQGMEGASRPEHFRGVTTVVAKLLNIVQPELAVFGAKDFQQAAVIGRMTRNLNFPVKILVVPTVRERDGLAMSSRNKYLAGKSRVQATVLWRVIQAARQAVRKAARPVPAARLKAQLKMLVAAVSPARLDYVEFFDPDSLLAVETVTRGTHMALAVFIGNTRLIDNARL